MPKKEIKIPQEQDNRILYQGTKSSICIKRQRVLWTYTSTGLAYYNKHSQALHGCLVVGSVIGNYKGDIPQWAAYSMGQTCTAPAACVNREVIFFSGSSRNINCRQVDAHKVDYARLTGIRDILWKVNLHKVDLQKFQKVEFPKFRCSLIQYCVCHSGITMCWMR